MFRKAPQPHNWILQIPVYKPGKPISEVKRELKLRNVYKLASNENPFGFSPLIKRNIKKLISDLNRYPESSSFYLRHALAKRFKVPPKKIIISNGSDELIVLALRAFVGRGDEVITSYPTFLIYYIQSAIEGAKVRRVPLKNFQYDLEGILKKINNRTKIIFIGNPDNPTGTYIERGRLNDFLNRVPPEVLVFLDEAYYEYASSYSDYPQTLRYLREMDNIIITRTFSKAWGLAGLRIGYGFSSSKIIEVLNRIREPFNVNTLAQRCALLSLKDNSFLKSVLKKTSEEKRYLYRQFRRMGLRFIETATNFIPLYIGKKAGKLCNELLQRGIIVRNLDSWGFKGFVRITVGKHSENRLLINQLRRLL